MPGVLHVVHIFKCAQKFSGSTYQEKFITSLSKTLNFFYFIAIFNYLNRINFSILHFAKSALKLLPAVVH